MTLGISIETEKIHPFITLGGASTPRAPLAIASIEFAGPAAPIVPNEPKIGGLKLEMPKKYIDSCGLQ